MLNAKVASFIILLLFIPMLVLLLDKHEFITIDDNTIILLETANDISRTLVLIIIVLKLSKKLPFKPLRIPRQSRF